MAGSTGRKALYLSDRLGKVACLAQIMVHPAIAIEASSTDLSSVVDLTQTPRGDALSAKVSLGTQPRET